MNKKVKYRVVITEVNGESYIIRLSATSAEHAESAAVDAVSNFYGEPFTGLVSAMI